MLRMILFSAFVLVSFFACKKDQYYRDSGTQDPHFKGNTLAYLDAVPFFFDSVAQVVRLSGMENVFTSDTLTFFAPTDRSIKNLVETLNDNLYMYGYDTIKTLADIPQIVWQKYLQRYMFHGANQLKDFPQIDFSLKSVYPGQDYLSWNNTTMNIGVVYADDNGVKYVGYRQLTLSYIPDLTYPLYNWNTAFVASSNILTDNGVVHALDKNQNYFGFDIITFLYDMIAVLQTGG